MHGATPFYELYRRKPSQSSYCRRARGTDRAEGNTLKSLLSFVQYFVPSQPRMYDIHALSDALDM